MADKTPTRTRGVRTRARLLEAAANVFERDGFLAARVVDIATQAGVAHGSFYTYFDSKEDVFRHVAADVMAKVYGALDAADDADPETALRGVPARFLALYEHHAAVLGLIEQVGAIPAFRELHREVRDGYVTRVEERLSGLAALPAGADPHLLAHALVGTLTSFSYAWFVLDEPFARDAALATLDAVWRGALGLSAG